MVCIVVTGHMAIHEVVSFSHYASETKICRHVFDYCVVAMEAGQLHVDAINSFGGTLGVLFFVNSQMFDGQLWERYWALGPNLALFWKGLSVRFGQEFLYKNSASSTVLRNTPAAWTDLGLVGQYGFLRPWIQEEIVDQRKQHKLRFAWIAAVVL